MVVRHTTGGLSTGSVLLLLLFLGCVFYFVGGAIVLHCIRGARGKEMIPNIDFWQNLPGLVKVRTLSSLHILAKKKTHNITQSITKKTITYTVK